MISEAYDFLGYDIAYAGGDFFSALRTGLFGSPWFDGKPFPELLTEFRLLLNRFGLFPSVEPIARYVRRFKQQVPSENRAKFRIWSLSLVE